MEAYKDYMIILSPPFNIAEQVKKFKLSSRRLIGDFEGMHSRAHITMSLLKRQKPFHTEPLIKRLEKELSLLEPGIFQLNGFATFLPTDYTTIYAAIKSTPVMEDWFKRLRKSLNEKKSVPHITIARQVPNEKAKKLWPKFKDRKWNEEFEVKRLTILHRETFGYEKIWRPFTEIPFRGNPEWNKLPEKTTKTGKKTVDINQISLF